jgi:hypothetical protein
VSGEVTLARRADPRGSVLDLLDLAIEDFGATLRSASIVDTADFFWRTHSRTRCAS